MDAERRWDSFSCHDRCLSFNLVSNLPKAPLRDGQTLTRDLGRACNLARLLQESDHFPCEEGDNRFAVTFMNGDFQLLASNNDCGRYDLRAAVKMKAFNTPSRPFESRRDLLFRVNP